MAENSIESNESQNLPGAVPTEGDYIANVKCSKGGYEIHLTPAALTHPDVFTAEEAWKYLKFPCKASFDRNCREYGIKGKKVGRERIYCREQLHAMRARMFGMDVPGKRKQF